MFSIIIPLYNSEDTIKTTLSSVLKQTFKEYEIIIVNDGSTDKGTDIIKDNFNDSRIKIINQENQGVSVARNTGVSNSKYTYLAFLDADDEWESGYLDKINIAINTFPDAGIICSAGYYKNFRTKERSFRVVEKYRNMILKINYFENPHVFTHTSAIVIAKEYFNKVEGGFPAKMKKNQDLALFYSVALHCDTVYSGYPLSNYSSNVDSQSTQINENAYIHVCNRFNFTFKEWEKVGRNNKLFEIFLKYELRHILLGIIKKSDYKIIDLHFKNLDSELLKLFSGFERYIYANKRFRLLAIMNIYLSKLLWRARGYPRVTNSKLVIED